MPNTAEKPTMSVTEAANLLGVSAPTMYAITERDDFTALIRVGRRKLVLRTKLLEWLEAQAIQPSSSASGETNEGQEVTP